MKLSFVNKNTGGGMRKFLLRLFVAVVAAMFAFSFVSCKKDDDEETGSSPALTSVSISGSSKVKPSETLELSATVNTTGNPTGITYKWEVTEGASLSPTNETQTTLTAGSDEKTVTVTFTATYGETVKSDTKEIKITNSLADLIVTPGAKVTTNGWADMANSGAGMSYPETDKIIVIDDVTYPTASEKLTAFTNAIASGSVTSSTVNDTAAIIVLSGTVDLSNGNVSDSDHTYFDVFNETSHAREHGDFVYEIGSNKAIIGVNEAKVAFGGLQIYANKAARTNIIIQNINFWDAHGSTEKDTNISGTYTENNKTYKYSDSKASADNLVLEANGGTKGSDGFYTYPAVPTNIWIDHCKFSDGTCSDLERNYNHDGSLDMKAGQYVTVSYCEFTNHDKVTLLAPNDTYVDPTQRQITFHHNYYHDAIQRMPRSRGCQVHLYNNYYNIIGNSGNAGYSLGPGIGSQFIVENNYFGTHHSKILKYFDTSSDGSSASTFSKLYQKDNNVTFTSSNMTTDGDTASSVTDHLVTSAPWTIDYTYEPATVSNLPTLIPTVAGVDKEGYTKTVSVNGTDY